LGTKLYEDVIFLDLPINEAGGIILGKEEGMEGMDPLVGVRARGVTNPFKPGIGMGMEDVVSEHGKLFNDALVTWFYPSESVEKDANRFRWDNGNHIGGIALNVAYMAAHTAILFKDSSGEYLHQIGAKLSWFLTVSGMFGVGSR